MRCSTIVPAIAAPIRRTAGCFSIALYIDVEKIPEFIADAVTGCAATHLRAGDVVDYAAVAGLKWRALRSAFDSLQGQCERRAPQDFENSAPSAAPLLSRFACFEVLRHRFKKPWWEWPEQWRQPDEARMRRVCAKGPDAAEIEFVEFVQWTADRQLAGLPATCATGSA